MNNLSYPNLRQSLFLIFLLLLLFSCFLFFTLTLPQLFGVRLTSLYRYIISIIAPIIWIPVIIYVQRKSGIQFNINFRVLGFQLVFVLLILGVVTRIISSPLDNPIEYFHNLITGKIKVVFFEQDEFNLLLIIRIIGTVLIVPIVEEIFFRKQILGILLKKHSPSLAIIISSVLFAVLHLRVNDIGRLFVWGFIYGVIFYRTNLVEASIFLHSFCNLSNLFIKYKFISVTELLLIKHIIIFIICLFIILMIIKHLGRYKTKNSSYFDEQTKLK